MAIFIGAIITVTLIIGVADQVVLQTTTMNIVNESVAAIATGNGTTTLTGRTLVGEGIVVNGTDGEVVLSPLNYSINSTIGSDGLLSVTLTRYDGCGATNCSGSVNVSYTFEPDGHSVNSNDRALITLILLMSALAIVVFVAAQLYKTGSMQNLLRR